METQGGEDGCETAQKIFDRMTEEKAMQFVDEAKKEVKRQMNEGARGE